MSAFKAQSWQIAHVRRQYILAMLLHVAHVNAMSMRVRFLSKVQTAVKGEVSSKTVSHILVSLESVEK